MIINIRAVFAAAILGLLATPASAVVIAGKIHIDSYAPYQTGTGVDDQSGVEIKANYSVTPGALPEDCCDPADLRWMQLVTSNKPTGFTPDPNRPFIDPREGQDIGGDTGDALPYYDVTYANAALTGGINNGVGPYIYDKPAVNNSRADDPPAGPYTFTAQTILVCIYDDESDPTKLVILGGFEWGFSITNDGGDPASYSVAAFPITPLSDTLGLRTAFNTALALDFPGYEIVDSACTDCDEVQFAVPEPSTLLLMIPLLAMLMFAGYCPLMRRPAARELAAQM